MTPSLVSSRQDLLKTLPPGLAIAELGVFAGDFSQEILDLCQPTQLMLIDRWEGMQACGDQHGDHIIWRDGEELFQAVLKRFSTAPEVDVVRGDSTLVSGFSDAFDFVYIDADHDEKAVYADLLAANLSLRASGMIGGHDYTPRFPGVEVAVKKFCRRYGWHVSLLTQDGCPSFLLKR
jgi:hypothetical protein